jgi:hypothetical protein
MRFTTSESLGVFALTGYQVRPSMVSGRGQILTIRHRRHLEMMTPWPIQQTHIAP